jgi:hypothetical protein
MRMFFFNFNFLGFGFFFGFFGFRQKKKKKKLCQRYEQTNTTKKADRSRRRIFRVKNRKFRRKTTVSYTISMQNQPMASPFIYKKLLSSASRSKKKKKKKKKKYASLWHSWRPPFSPESRALQQHTHTHIRTFLKNGYFS